MTKTNDIDTNQLQAFVSGYLAAGLWTAIDHDGNPLSDALDKDGNSLDGEFSVGDFAKTAIKEATKDCTAFIQANQSLLAEANSDFSQHGYDFWLTRNGHGAGFWDRGYGEVGDKLTEAAKAYGEAYVMVNRKKLHIHRG